MSRKRRGQILLLMVSLLASLAALEFALRARFPFYDPRRQIMFEIDPAAGAAFGPRGETIRQRTPKGDYDLRVSFNRHGFRDTRDVLEATAQDVFVLGDSFSMGWGVEEPMRYSSRLEALTGRKVFNISVPNDLQGYRGVLRYVRAQGATVSNLVLGLCMNNDLKNYETGERMIRYGDRQRWKARLRGKLQAHSALYLFLSYEIQRHPPLRRICEKLGISRDIGEITLRNEYDAAAMASTRDEILKLTEGIPPGRLTVMLIPTLALWEGDNQPTERRIHEDFAVLLREAGLPVLDLLAPIEATGHPRALYFETDPHWNAHGHEVAARALAERLAVAAVAAPY